MKCPDCRAEFVDDILYGYAVVEDDTYGDYFLVYDEPCECGYRVGTFLEDELEWDVVLKGENLKDAIIEIVKSLMKG